MTAILLESRLRMMHDNTWQQARRPIFISADLKILTKNYVLIDSHHHMTHSDDESFSTIESPWDVYTSNQCTPYDPNDDDDADSKHPWHLGFQMFNIFDGTAKNKKGPWFKWLILKHFLTINKLVNEQSN